MRVEPYSVLRQRASCAVDVGQSIPRAPDEFLGAVMETSAFEFGDDEKVAAAWAQEMSDRIGRRW
ncbi:MAG: hypothetical protein H6523_13380 [Mycolicibacterium sp.]|nr:hypothetical protein [Mycolicibacterium sp.]